MAGAWVAVAVLSGYVLALLAPLLHRVTRSATGWVLALAPLSVTIYFASLIPRVAGEPVSFRWPWVPRLGLELSFYLDGLSLLFALVISAIGVLVLIYSGGYLAGHRQLGRFYGFLLLFMASMLGLVLAGNVLTLYLFWELTSVSSFLLIGFEHEKRGAPEAAWQALMVTALGGQVMLVGLLLLGLVGGGTDLATLLGQGDLVRAHPLYLPILLLVATGAFTKSAQVPFHFWLPAAMLAPTPVSAYLHSATMVKAGVYLLARLSPVLGGTGPWHALVTGVGAVTMLVGALLAVESTDLKRILAYATISVLGALVFLLGVGSPLAVEAALLYLLVHALYKGALFLVAGNVDHETGTREVGRLAGLRRAMPITAAVAGLAALSMAGLPPFFGFVGKELVYEAALQAPWATLALTAAALLAFVGLVAVAGIVSLGPFFGKLTPSPEQPHEVPPSMWLGALLLAGLGLLLGLWPGSIGEALVGPAATAVLGHRVQVELALWHGLTPMLALSAVSLAAGVGAFALRRRLREALGRLRAERWGPARWYDLGVEGLNWLAHVQTSLLQNGHLRYYLLTVLLTLIAVVGGTLALRGGGLPPAFDWSDLRFYEVTLVVVMLLAALTATQMTSRLAAIAALGVVGYSVALLFLFFGAPDLAMAQFLIETLAVILFVLAFYHLPQFTKLSGNPARVRDLVAALTGGGLMAALVLMATSVEYAPPISEYYAERSFVEAHGHNVVNVILVDFRALDTLGEITVLAAAGVGVLALLSLRPKDREG